MSGPANPLLRQAPIPNPCDLPGIGGVCDLGKTLANPGGIVTHAASSAFDSLVQALLDSFGKALQWCLTWWVRLPSPDLQQMTALARVREYTSGLQLLLLTGAVMFTAARLATARRGGLTGATQEAFVGFARTVFGSWMYAGFVVAGTRAGDAFSDWIITDATHGDGDAVLTRMTSFDTLTGKGLGSGALFLIAILGLLSALLQLVLLVVRQALLIVAAAAVPVAAAAAGTGPGSQSYQRLLAWSLAFVLFKPVGALVYAVAFSAAGTDSDDPQQVLLGLILLALVAVVAPALMRMIAPAISTIGGGGGGGAAIAAGGFALAAHGLTQRGGGDDAGARTVSEADHTGGGGGSGGASGGGSGGGSPAGDGGGGGGRAVAGTGSEPAGTSSGATQSSSGSGGGTSTGAAGTAGSRDAAASASGGAGQGAAAAGSAASGGAASGSAASGGAASGGAASGGAASGGVVGAAIGAGMQAISAGGEQVRSAVETGTAPPELGPHEVPR